MPHSASGFEAPNDDELAPITVALRIFAHGSKPRMVLIDHDEFTIGSDAQCNLRLAAGAPRLQSILHVQGRAVWIEAQSDDALVTVEQNAYRRRALRDGDQLQFDGLQATVQIGEPSTRKNPLPALRSARLPDDLSALSAEELCDQIELEESHVHNFEQRRRFGWGALMSAVRDVIDQDSVRSPQPVEAAQVAAISDEKFNELITHVRELSETLDERTKSLAAQESLLIESSSQLCESQVRVSRQLEELLERIAPEVASGELRASA
jgi:hypothetical protein